MSLPIDVSDLIHQKKVERTRIEYKSGWNPEPIIQTITAFANDFDNMGGGYILIGVEEENGRPKLPLLGLDSDNLANPSFLLAKQRECNKQVIRKSINKKNPRGIA